MKPFVQPKGPMRQINNQRMAIQRAADAVWPYSDKPTRPIREAFRLPQNRPFNG